MKGRIILEIKEENENEIHLKWRVVGNCLSRIFQYLNRHSGIPIGAGVSNPP